MPTNTLHSARLFCTALGLGFAVSSAGCADGKDSGGDDGGLSGGEAGTVSATASGSAGDGDGDGDDGAVPVDPYPARGITLVDAFINQGVQIPLVSNGSWVGGAGRNARIIKSRDSLVRATYELPENWEPRNIRGRLTLSHSDGTSKVLERDLLVEASSFLGTLSRTIWFGVEGVDIRPGTSFSISILETEGGHESEPESAVHTVPVGGPNFIGVEPDPMQLKVTLVAVDYQTPNCQTTIPLDDPDVLDGFVNNIWEKTPVEEIVYTVRSQPIVWTSTLDSLAELWSPLQQMRSVDGAGPNEYYYAIVDPCMGGVDGAGGIAPGLPPATQSAASQRVSSGIWRPGSSAASFGYETFTHELGHNQGLAHVFCPGGNSAGDDPNYPDPNGRSGVWGFGIKTFQLKSPTANYDYMSYCQPYWVGDWTWNKTWDRIRILTSWDGGAPPNPDELPVAETLFGLLLPDGQQRWWTAEGAYDPELASGLHELRYAWSGEDESQSVAPQAIENHDGSILLIAPLPREPLAIDHIEHEGPRGVTWTPREDIRTLAQAEAELAVP